MKFLGPHCAIIGRFEISLDANGSPEFWGGSVLKRLCAVADTVGIHALWTDGSFRGPVENSRVNDVFYKDHPNSSVWLDDGWHHDGAGAYDSLLLWSNVDPTEIRLADRTIVRPEPGEVAVVMNELVEHRMPKVVGANRQFARISFFAPAWLKEETCPSE